MQFLPLTWWQVDRDAGQIRTLRAKQRGKKREQVDSSRGFMAMWQRCILAAIEEKVLTAESRFTFHDLRAYYATQHKAQRGTLPDLHKNPETTARVYDRNKVVKRSAL